MQGKKTYPQIEDLKNKIFDLSLIFSVSIGFITYLLSLTRYGKTGFEISFVTDLLALLLVLGITIFRKRLNIKIKTYVIIAAIFVVFLIDVLNLGVFSANKVLIVLIPFFLALAFSLKKAIIGFMLAIIGFFIISYFHLSGILTVPPQDDIKLSAWIINILLIIIVTIIVLIIQNKFNFTYIKLISDLEKTNELISEQERNYRAIFNSSTDAIFLHDLNGNILDVNSSMLKMYGYERDEIASVEISELSSGKDIYTAHDAEEYVKKAILGAPQVFDWQAKKKNGENFWVEVALKKTSIGGNDRVLAVVRDINDKKENALQLELYRNHLKELVAQRTKELEQANEKLHSTNDNLAQQKEELVTTINELQKTQEQLVQSEKMASLGILASGVAHEINNPLNFIQGGLYGLKNYFEEELNDHQEQVKPLLNAINVGVERASDIATSLNHYCTYNSKQV